MTTTETRADDSLNILVDELLADDELRETFFRDPDETLRLAGDWALPLSESELRSLQSPSFRIWEKVVERLDRLPQI